MRDRDVYEIHGKPIKEEVAINSGDVYNVYIRTIFSEKEAILYILNHPSFKANFNSISFPLENGSIKSYFSISKNNTLLSIPIELETEVEKVSNYEFNVTLKQKWDAKDFNFDNEHTDILEHKWTFNVKPGIINTITDAGSKTPQSVN